MFFYNYIIINICMVKGSGTQKIAHTVAGDSIMHSAAEKCILFVGLHQCG